MKSKTKKTASKAKADPRMGRAAEGPGPKSNGRRMQLGKRDGIQSLVLLKDSTIKIYQDMYKDIFKKGALDRKTKELIAIAAAAVSGCEGCLNGHIRKARALGANMDEIKETVAVAFAVNAATVVDRSDVAAAVLNLNDEE